MCQVVCESSPELRSMLAGTEDALKQVVRRFLLLTPPQVARRFRRKILRVGELQQGELELEENMV